MVHYIENDKLTLGVKEFGCEITSIKSKATDYEFMWQGNPDIWGGQAPILFPIVGRLIDDKYTLDGKEYEMLPGDISLCNVGRFHGFLATEDSILIVVG